MDSEVTGGAADAKALIARGYQLALGRDPTRAETATAAEFVDRGERDYTAAGQADARSLALADFCQALMGLNEFVYLD